MPVLVFNRQVRRDYEILEKFEAGVVLSGGEVKSLKNGRGQMRGSYVKVDMEREVYLYGAHISPYQPAGQKDYDPERPRKLLLSKSEIEHLLAAARGKNLTIVPVKVYTARRGLIKVEIALARGKRKHEKRRKIQEIQDKREIQRTLKRYK